MLINIGAGGSVYITTLAVKGNGLISANGGKGSQSSGNGGGGRYQCRICELPR